MKKVLIVVCAFLCIFSLTACKEKIVGEKQLIIRAREELKTANADTIDLVIAGQHTKDGKCLFWFISGNEYQAHTYLPIEFELLGENQYEFVKSYKPIDRGMDVCSLMWKNGYSFVVNNEKCRQIRIDGQYITVNTIPFTYYHNGPLGSYDFLDENGNAL